MTDILQKIVNKLKLDKIANILNIGVDKILHFIAGFLIFVFMYIIFNVVVISLFVVIIIALIKEIYDGLPFVKNHTRDFWDFVFTVLGGLFALVLVYLIYYFIK